MPKEYTETKRFKELAKQYLKEMDKKFPIDEKAIKNITRRQTHS